MRLGGYMNQPKETEFLELIHGIECLMHHPHEPIMYSIFFCQTKQDPTSMFPQIS